MGSATPRAAVRRVLVVDIGGTHVKIYASGRPGVRQFRSGPTLPPQAAVAGVLRRTRHWRYNAVSIGFPGPVLHGRPLHDPVNLGPGWVGFDFRRAFRRPVKLVNDAAMQALGAYHGGRMLFLGLGTGLGSAMIVDGKLEPFELAHLPYRKGRTYEEYLGKAGLKRLGAKRWQRRVFDVVDRFRTALEPEYVVIGGGNAKRLTALPAGCSLGRNADAFPGGLRLWDVPPAAPKARRRRRRARARRSPPG